MEIIDKIIKGLVPDKYHKAIVEFRDRVFGNPMESYSQEGEDMILTDLFGRKRSGFYVDVGAYHPKLYSNTYFFYKRGWRGINIDATPGSMKAFKRLRPRDINLEVPISNTREKRTYKMFNEPGLNSFSKVLSQERDSRTKYKIINEVELETYLLSEVLDTYLPNDIYIDFLSVDTEGWDLNVLKSNNWEKYKPKVILVESLNFAFSNPDQNDVYIFLNDTGYDLIAKTTRTMIFIIKV